MAVFTTGKGFEATHVINGFDWNSLCNASVVDIGGSRGHIGIEIARHFPLLHVTVQDLESTVSGAESEVPPEAAGRVHFMAHDFFVEQPVVANVYFLRWILHNWSDKYCIKILRSLIPALRPGAQVIVQEICMPEPGTIVNWREKQLRSVTSKCKPSITDCL